MSNRFACVRVSGNRESWVRDNVLNMEGNIEWFVKHADALLKQARREERERIIGWLSDDDLEKVITVQQAIDEIRAIPEKPLQQIDTNVKELPQTAPSHEQVSTVHDTGETHSESMQADENTNGTAGEQEPKPCPFCGLSMYYDAPSRQWMHPDVDDCVLWQFKVCDDDVPLWNRRASVPKARIRKLEPLREEPEELSDTERQEAGYPATRETLIRALRDAEDTLTNNGICSGGVNNPYADELGEIRDRIRDILSREENHD